MASWGLRVVPIALALIVAGEYFTAPRPNSSRALLSALTEQLRFTYHECVPLGWKPVAADGTYYPGYTASMQTYAEWLDAVWRGRIEQRDLRAPDAREVFDVLNHLAAQGLLEQKPHSQGYDYYLTSRAFRYFFASSVYGDNHDSLPYLCYSIIVPDRIVWLQQVASLAPQHAPKMQWYRVQFTWKPGAPAGWAADKFLREHSVVLAPLTSPTAAKVFYSGGQWQLTNIYDRGWMLPALSATSGQKKKGLR